MKLGRIIEGKKEYGKRIDFGNLPNATSKTISSGLSNVTFTKIEGIAQNINTPSNVLPLPYIDPRNLSAGIMLSLISDYKIAIVTAEDKTGYSGIVTIYYTKN